MHFKNASGKPQFDALQLAIMKIVFLSAASLRIKKVQSIGVYPVFAGKKLEKSLIFPNRQASQ
ncbi:hypothetical protein [Flavobacterium humidisoli]|uniref:Uncharacterized protein n=1 Tax=Flavobacterium humidisoli TaxID=2937442 RepID=A0ABY4LNZ5_9FLAO|nr:hypothetical protein [Flavobacterium humidisoli]UPZ14813.1 hypothetical protein M0M44_18875 [Flavobacterium humidisoli]